LPAFDPGEFSTNAVMEYPPISRLWQSGHMRNSTMRVHSKRVWRAAAVLSGIALILSPGSPVSASASEAQATTASHLIPPLVSGDEPIVVTEHRIQSTHGPLVYEARVGRLPIRSEETGELRGHIFFVAYVVKSKGPPRPITFAWNGGPTVASDIIHMEGLGPRRRTKNGMVSNAETLLADSDLVFYDAMETGFSRPEKPEFAAEFLNLKGDVAATAEFMRAYRARFRTVDQPLFIAGESYGVFRAAALADLLTERGEKIAGVMLISGDIANIPMPIPFYDAMHVPARTATAFFYHRLPPELLQDREATMKAVNQWATAVYQPALEHLAQLSEADREKIATDLARFTGLRPDQVDRKTLVVHAEHYLEDFFDGDRTRTLSGHDMRETDSSDDPSAAIRVDRYLRDELGYATDLTYAGLEDGYMPTPGHPRRATYEQFYYNADSVTKEDLDRTKKESEVTYIARDNPPWIINAMRRDKTMPVFVATGRYDPLNMCEGDVAATATAAPEFSSRIFNHCYEGGHIMYRDEAARLVLARDLSDFVRKALAAQPAAAPAQK
jgi:carboxypeptidase C (cathepsin A)